MIINYKQIKAARALLDLKQGELATLAKISIASLAAIEQNKGSPKNATLNKIKKALEATGIIFTDEPGVKMRRDIFDIQILKGHEAIIQVWRDIEYRLKKTKGGEVLLSGVDERIWIERYRDDLKDTLNIRDDLNIKTRFLIAEGDSFLTCPRECYRAIPKMLFQQTPYYVYEDHVAFINWGPPQTVILIQSPAMAQAFRNQFEFNWSRGRALDPSKVVMAAL